MDDTKPTNQTTSPEESKEAVKTTPDEVKLQADLTKAAAQVEGVSVEEVKAEEGEKSEVSAVEVAEEDTKVEEVGKKEAPVVEEHAISEIDAKKFAGQGDFALPVSPLDDLIGKPAGAAVNPEVKTEIPEGLPAEKKEAPLHQDSEEQASEKTEEKEVEEKKVEAQPQPVPEKKVETQQPIPEKNVTAAPMPVPKSSMKDLEKQAAGMLKQLDDKGKKSDKKDELGEKEAKPKKKRSRAVTSMALAAVLVVMMGAGGIVGMNLLKIQQVADERSQAYEYPGSECTTNDNPFCQKYPNGENTGYECYCVAWSEYTNEGVWRCDRYSSSCAGDDGNVTFPMVSGCYENVDGKLVQVPSYGDVSVSGKCLVGSGTPKARWLCKDAENLPPNGCQDDYDETADPNATTLCADAPSSSWCGAIQVDFGNLNDKGGCFVSALIPCSSTPPTTEPATPQCNDSCNSNDDCPSEYPCINGSCRNELCDTETDCTCPVVEALMCTDLTASDSREIGDTVTLTCNHSGDNFEHAEYRYNVDGGDWVALGVTNTFVISDPGTYAAQCRVCKTDGTCTTWGAAN